MHPIRTQKPGRFGRVFIFEIALNFERLQRNETRVKYIYVGDITSFEVSKNLQYIAVITTCKKRKTGPLLTLPI